MLVDTGATVSLLRPDVAQKMTAKMSKSRHTSLHTASGEGIPVCGECMVLVGLGGRQVKHPFLVAPIRDKAILGLDFLRKVNACVDLAQSTLAIWGTQIPLKRRWQCVEGVPKRQLAGRQVRNHVASVQDTQLEHEEPGWMTVALENSDLVPGSQEWKRLKGLFHQRRAAFATESKFLGRTHLVQHSIDTGDSRPLKQAPRRIPYSQREHIDTLIQEMVEQDVIEPSRSPWASPVVLVPKKDGTTRFCVDYRRLNKVTKKDSYALPCIHDLLDVLGGSSWFCVLDLKSGYWQVEMKPEDKEKTAFTIYGKGLWQFKVMPFGLTNAPATFQRLMETVVPRELALPYLDDLIIYGPNFDTVLSKLERVLNCLQKANLQVNVKKCSFFKRQTRYLGHLISERGVQTDPDKTKVVREWPEPKNKKDVKRFLGFCSYYRRFVKNFAGVTKPLTCLTQAEVPFVWDEPCRSSFQKLKDVMTSAPVLAFPDLSKPFIVDCDASGHAIGAVLSQEHDGREHAVSYFSQTLSRQERNYCATRRELLAVLRSISHFHQYLYGKEFCLRTDHAALTWLTSFHRPEGQLARWLEKLQSYNFKIVHRAGVRHANADGLSRRPCGIDCKYCQRREEADKLEVQVVQLTPEEEGFQNDPGIEQVKFWKSQGKCPDNAELTGVDPIVRQLVNRWELLEVREGKLYHLWVGRAGEKIAQLVVPQGRREQVLTECHDRPTGGHFGFWKSLARIRQSYFWPGMTSDIRSWCRTCQVCRKFKGPGRRNPAPLQQMTVGAPFERIGVDILGPFPRSDRGNRYVLVVADYFSKWPEAVALPNQEAVTIASALVEQVFSRTGIPLEIHTDQGRNFEAALVKEVSKLLGMHRTRSTALHPQSAGLVERLNRTLTKHLAMFVNKCQTDWDEKIPLFLMAYRSTPQGTTGFSPAQVIYGRDLHLPEHLVRTPQHPQVLNTPYAMKLRHHLEQVRRFASEEAQLKLRFQKEWFDRRAKRPLHKEGDWVWVFEPKRSRGICPKLQPLWTGPWVVTKRHNEVLFDVQMGKKIRRLHANRMTKAEIRPGDRSQEVEGVV